MNLDSMLMPDLKLFFDSKVLNDSDKVAISLRYQNTDVFFQQTETKPQETL